MPRTDGVIHGKDLCNESVPTRVLEDDAVDTDKLADNAVDTDKLACPILLSCNGSLSAPAYAFDSRATMGIYKTSFRLEFTTGNIDTDAALSVAPFKVTDIGWSQRHDGIAEVQADTLPYQTWWNPDDFTLVDADNTPEYPTNSARLVHNYTALPGGVAFRKIFLKVWAQAIVECTDNSVQLARIRVEFSGDGGSSYSQLPQANASNQQIKVGNATGTMGTQAQISTFAYGQEGTLADDFYIRVGVDGDSTNITFEDIEVLAELGEFHT